MVPTTAPTERPSFWGRSARLGGGSGRLLTVSALVGLVIGNLIALVSWVLATQSDRSADDRYPLIMALIMFALSVPMAFMAAWALLVERTSVRGATRNPEQSIESRWYEQATAGAFGDTMIATGLGTFVLALGGWQFSPSLVGVGVLLVMMASVIARFLILRARG